MKRRCIIYLCWITTLAGVAIGGWVVEGWAADSLLSDTTIGQWMHTVMTNFSRATWDTTMRWVNFGILVALFFKYAKTPLSLFIKGKQEETAQSIQQMEKKKSEAEAKILDGQMQLKNSQERLVLIKERVLADGQRRKAQIIDQARQESRRMLESARLKVDSQIREAYNTVRIELIDMATEKAAVKLPQIITENDQQQWVEHWMAAAKK